MTTQSLAAFIGGWEIILLGVIGLWMAFWIWMLVDCANNEPSKVAWILIILFASCVGAPVYYFVRKLPRENANKTGGPDAPKT